MALPDDVRRACAEIAAGARSVRIDLDALEALDPGTPPALDAEAHYLEAPPDDVATYLLALDAINFGSGWFPTLRKRRRADGTPVSGYFTVAWALADRFRARGPWSAAELRAMRTEEIAGVLGQPPDHELMALYAQALRELGTFLGERTALDPESHYLEGPPEEVAAYLLTLGAVNFGSGWFPTLRKRPGRSGYFTVAQGLAERFRAEGPWSPAELREVDATTLAAVLGQDPGHELIRLYAEALRDLGRFLGQSSPLEAVEAAGGSAERLAAGLAAGMAFFDDRGFWKRAQITASDLALAGVARFHDLDRLTAFADNLVPHVLRVDGVLVYDERLAARVDRGELLPPGDEEHEIRACALHACELIATRLRVPPRTLDGWLWNRGQGARYKALPRHRTRTVYY